MRRNRNKGLGHRRFSCARHGTLRFLGVRRTSQKRLSRLRRFWSQRLPSALRVLPASLHLANRPACFLSVMKGHLDTTNATDRKPSCRRQIRHTEPCWTLHAPGLIVRDLVAIAARGLGGLFDDLCNSLWRRAGEMPARAEDSDWLVAGARGRLANRRQTRSTSLWDGGLSVLPSRKPKSRTRSADTPHAQADWCPKIGIGQRHPCSFLVGVRDLRDRARPAATLFRAILWKRRPAGGRQSGMATDAGRAATRIGAGGWRACLRFSGGRRKRCSRAKIRSRCCWWMTTRPS